MSTAQTTYRKRRRIDPSRIGVYLLLVLFSLLFLMRCTSCSRLHSSLLPKSRI